MLTLTEHTLNTFTMLFVGFGLIVAISITSAHSTVEQADDGSSGSIKFTTPDLHDDEAHSPWMPEQLRCDACTAVAYQLYEKFNAYNEKRKSLKYKIPESEILDMFESTCENSKTWEGYGMKTVKKVHRLSGAGMEVQDVPGITAGGGKWPMRLQDMCEQYAGELGEMTIYNQYKKKPHSKQAFEDYLCRGTGIRGDCTTVDSASRDEL